MSKSSKRSPKRTRAAAQPRRRVADGIVEVRPAAPDVDQVTLLGPPMQASLNWMDASASCVDGWLEWQRMLWQPYCDWQAAIAWRWCEVWAPSLIEPAVMRGEEQLA
jgi:hypothetical protein